MAVHNQPISIEKGENQLVSSISSNEFNNWYDILSAIFEAAANNEPTLVVDVDENNHVTSAFSINGPIYPIAIPHHEDPQPVEFTCTPYQPSPWIKERARKLSQAFEKSMTGGESNA